MNKRLLSFITLFFLLTACEKDWNTLEKWEELYAVYGTLNLKDTAQYVRINRVFASAGDPHLFLQQSDSVNVNPQDFEVTLEQWQDGSPVGQPFVMYPSKDYPKEAGDFTSDNYWVFKTNHRLVIDSEYRLQVKNTTTGYEMAAIAATFGRRTLHQSFLEKRYYNITQYKAEKLDYDGSLAPDQFEKMVQRFLYLEITPADTIEKILDWRPWLDHLKQGDDDSTQQFTDDYFKFIGSSIPVMPDVKRIAVGVDKLLIVNSEELQLFIDLGETGTSLHYNPDYTNFNRGTGIFESRYYYTFFAIQLRPETLDSIAMGRFTKDLNFSDSQGNWY